MSVAMRQAPPSAKRAAARAIDDAASGPVLVVGSLPPDGRDLDLLASPRDHAAISRTLEESGYLRWRQTWARIGDPEGYGVDVASTARWTTRGHEAAVLFAGAEPIPGFARLCRPGAATVVLLAARATVNRHGRVTDKVRARVDAALDRDPACWADAEERAASLGMRGALALLGTACASGRPPTRVRRAAGLAQVLWHDGSLLGKVRFAAGVVRGRRRPPIVSFSGLDGSGKSTQADRLQEHLGQLGITTVSEWGGNFKTGSRLRAAVPLLDRPVGARRGLPQGRDRIPAALLGSPAGTQAWVFYVMGLNTVHLWRLVLRRRPETTLLIFDRFSPDTAAKLELHFERSRDIDIRWQRRLFTKLCPKPDVGFLVDVSGDVAYSRRQEQTHEELTVTSELYQDQVPRFGLHRLDGTQPSDELARRVAVTTWQSLS